MLTHPTLDQLQQLGLAGMARAFAELEANPSQRRALPCRMARPPARPREPPSATTVGCAARLRYARLRHQAAVEDVDYRAARGLDRTLFQALIAGRWIEEAQNLIIEGPTESRFIMPISLSSYKAKVFWRGSSDGGRRRRRASAARLTVSIVEIARPGSPRERPCRAGAAGKIFSWIRRRTVASLTLEDFWPLPPA